MQISNGIKQEYYYKNKYKLIYRQIKEEIKNVVINRYISQIDNLSKKVENLLKENLLLKNDLIYILKRVLLSHNNYNNNNKLNKRNSNFGKFSPPKNITMNEKRNTSFYNKSYNSFFSLVDTINYDNYNNIHYFRNINNSIGKSPSEQIRYSIDDEFRKGNTSLSPLESSRQTNVQNKINFYLNSLYKHNFAEEGVAGTTSVHLLNKNQSIYDELFCNRNNRNKVIKHLNTDINYRKISNSKGKLSQKRKTVPTTEDYNKRNKKNMLNNYKVKKTRTNGYLKVNKKEVIQKIKPKLSNTNNSKKEKLENKFNNNINVNIYFRNTKFNTTNLSSRSKFLVNKF